jgi:hypothetical protein
LKPLTIETIEKIRKRKQEGASLRQLANEFKCAKATASLYCRDLFEHTGRKYQSEKEARQTPILKCKGKPRKRYPSDNKKYPRKKYPHKKYLYHCSSEGCLNMITRKGGLCIKCYTAKLIKDSEKREAIHIKEREESQRLRLEREVKRFKPAKIEICPSSPIERHYWIINSENLGICKYCGEKRQFIQEG